MLQQPLPRGSISGWAIAMLEGNEHRLAAPAPAWFVSKVLEAL
jgi:hypothetical protein